MNLTGDLLMSITEGLCSMNRIGLASNTGMDMKAGGCIAMLNFPIIFLALC